MAVSITKEEQVFFLNSTQLRGVQNVNFEYQVNAGVYKAIGLDYFENIVAGPQQGRVNVDAYLISSDILLPLTGEASVNGFLLKTKTNSTENYSFTTGYLTSYTSRGGVGEVAQISASFDVYGNIGRISTTEASNFAAIASSTPPNVTIAHPGSILLNISDFSTKKVLSYDINISVERRADFILGSIYPVRVKTNWPIEIVVNLSVSAAEYTAYSLRNFPSVTKKSDISIQLKSIKNSSVAAYSFSNMVLISESYSADIENKSIVNLSFRGFIEQKKEMPKEGLLFYLNSYHPKSIVNSSVTTWKDLTFNKNHFSLNNTTNSQRLIFFNGTSSYLQSQSALHTTSAWTFGAWVKSTDFENIPVDGSCIIGIGEHGVLFENNDGPAVNIRTSADNVYNTALPTPNIWNHICFVVDGTNFKYYHNSVLIFNWIISSSPFEGSPQSPVNITIGCDFNQDHTYLGHMNKIAFYNRALSQTEVLNIYFSTFVAN